MSKSTRITITILDHGAEIFRLHGMTKVDTEKVVANLARGSLNQAGETTTGKLLLWS